MDTTQTEKLLSDLKSADPADAPELADALTARLAQALDGPASSEDGEAPPPMDGEPS